MNANESNVPISTIFVLASWFLINMNSYDPIRMFSDNLLTPPEG